MTEPTVFQSPVGTHDVMGEQSALWEGMLAIFAQFALSLIHI